MADAGASCPLFYPIDMRALEGLEYVPPLPLPSGVPGLRPPSVTSPPCPLGAWPTSQGDTLRFSILVTGGPKTVRFYGRTLTQGDDYVPFSQLVTGNSATTPATASITMPAGCLLNVDAAAVGGIGAATIYVLAELGHVEGGVFIPYAQALSGLLTGYGVASSVASAAGSGGGGNGVCACIGTYVVEEPANDAQIYIERTPAAGTAESLASAVFTVTTVAAVANRFVSVFITDQISGNNRGLYTDPNVQLASTSFPYSFSILGPTAVIEAGGTVYEHNVSLGAPQWFTDTWSVDIQLTNVQTGDLIKFVAVWINIVNV